MNSKVLFSSLLLFLALIYKASGSSSRDAKLKALNPKTKLHQKIFLHHHHHNHHHRHHHHHPHHHHNHDKYQHHHHHHHNPIKQYLHHSHHYFHPHNHHHHHHHHHNHNPVKHYLHHSHHHHYHHHPHKHPLNQYHKKILQPHPVHGGHHDNQRSHISHLPRNVTSKLKLHVQIKDSQAVKRQSLPDMLSNLGQNLMKLGNSMTPKQSDMHVPVNSTDNPDKKGDVMHGLPIPQFSFAAEGLSSTAAVIPTHSQGNNITVGDLEALLHEALDGASGDDIGSGSKTSSGSGIGDEMTDTVDTKEATKTGDSLTASGSSLHQNQSSPESGDRRNQTFPEEPEIYRLSESREHDVSERHSAYSHDDAAEESMQRDNKVGQTDGKEKSRPVYGDQSKDADQWKTGLTDSADTRMGEQFENIHENGTQGEPSRFTNQFMFDEPRRPDMNSTFDDIEGSADNETNTAVEGSYETVTAKKATQDRTEQEEIDEASGSGDEPAAETNTGHADQPEENLSQRDTSEKKESHVPILDEDANGSGQNIDQNGIEHAEGREHEQEAVFDNTAKQDTFDESKQSVPGGTIDQDAAVNVVGNQIMANQNEAILKQKSSKESQTKDAIDAVDSDDKFFNKAAINKPGTPATGERVDQSATSKDGSEFSSGDFDTPVTQHVSNEPERVISETNLEKGFHTQDEQPIIQDFQQNQLNEPERINSAANLEKRLQTQDEQPNIQDVQENQLNKPDQPVVNDIDDGSGASNLDQELTDESAWAQDQGSQTENTRLTEELSSPSDAYSRGVDTEGTQIADLHGVQEPNSEDYPDEIPVYTLSLPSGEEFAREESTASPIFAAPTSSIPTLSASYLEPPSLPEGESTFSAIDAPSQDDQFASPTERLGFQTDMLDDPVLESLDTAIDSRRSTVAKVTKVTS